MFSLLCIYAGRAGRVSPGTCYRIVPRDFYEEFIPEFGIPEMQVSALSTLERVTYLHIAVYRNNLQTLLGIHEFAAFVRLFSIHSQHE